MTDHEPRGELAMAALLTDELRGRLYRLVRRRRQLSRDEAAAELGISRGLAAFHLDKLVAAGLLRARTQAAEGTSPGWSPPQGLRALGPGAGDHHPRTPLRAGRRAPGRRRRPGNPGEPPLAAATRVATDRGTELGARFRQRRGLGRLGPERALTAASELLEQLGYEPERRDQHLLRLRNCPFHALARRAPEIVCAINQALLDGILRGLGDQRIQAELAPRPGACCVELRGPGARR